VSAQPIILQRRFVAPHKARRRNNSRRPERNNSRRGPLLRGHQQVELRLLNGMNPPVPEVTVLIHRITKDRRAGLYELHIKKVLGFKHWDKWRQKPKR